MTELKQLADEPVAWMYDWKAEGITLTDCVSLDYDEAHSLTTGDHNIRPLYTRPQPPRKWVGLTKGEMMEVANRANTYTEAVQMTAAVLREKNT